jgi:hypothetical protein
MALSNSRVVTRLPVSATPISRSWDRAKGVATQVSPKTDYRNLSSLIQPQGSQLAVPQRRCRCPRSRARANLAWKGYDRLVFEVFSMLKLAAVAPLLLHPELPPSTAQEVHCPSTKDVRRANNCAISATTGYPYSPSAVSPPTLVVPQSLAVPMSSAAPPSLAAPPSSVCPHPHHQNSVTEGGFFVHSPFYRPTSPVASPMRNAHFLSEDNLLRSQMWSMASTAVCACTRRFGWTAYWWCFADSYFDFEGVRRLRFLAVLQTGIGCSGRPFGGRGIGEGVGFLMNGWLLS